MIPTFGRIEAVAHCAKAINARTYLEIGCRDDECFAHLRTIVPTSIGIDPIMGGTHRMTSDEFFAQSKGQTWDLIFIDGDHHHDQVANDLRNAIDSLNPDGVIVMHDVWPFAPHMEDPSYSGTVWRAFVAEGRTRSYVEGFAAKVPGDPVGVGLLRLRPNSLLITDPMLRAMEVLTLGMMFDHEHDWMRHIPFDHACKRLGLPPP